MFYAASEDWTFIDSFYWVCQTITSVGYGDFVLENDQTKIFAIFYILGSCCIYVHCVNSIYEYYEAMGRKSIHLDCQWVDEIIGDRASRSRLKVMCDVLTKKGLVKNKDLVEILAAMNHANICVDGASELRPLEANNVLAPGVDGLVNGYVETHWPPPNRRVR